VSSCAFHDGGGPFFWLGRSDRADFELAIVVGFYRDRLVRLALDGSADQARGTFALKVFVAHQPQQMAHDAHDRVEAHVAVFPQGRVANIDIQHLRFEQELGYPRGRPGVGRKYQVNRIVGGVDDTGGQVNAEEVILDARVAPLPRCTGYRAGGRTPPRAPGPFGTRTAPRWRPRNIDSFRMGRSLAGGRTFRAILASDSSGSGLSSAPPASQVLSKVGDCAVDHVQEVQVRCVRRLRLLWLHHRQATGAELAIEVQLRSVLATQIISC